MSIEGRKSEKQIEVVQRYIERGVTLGNYKDFMQAFLALVIDVHNRLSAVEDLARSIDKDGVVM